MSQSIYTVFPSENFIDMSLYQFGWEHCDPAHSFGPARRNHFLFHYVCSGTGVLSADNGQGHSISYQIHAGQGFMIFPHQICTYTADLHDPWEYIWIEFDGLRAREMVEFAGFSTASPIYSASDTALRDQMRHEMFYIVKEKASPFHLIGHLYLFIDSLVRSSDSAHQSSGNSLRNFYIQEALHFIEQNYQNPITIEDIAASCGLNRSYFGKIFHETIGKSPQEFLITYRMTKATELLKLTSRPIAEIGISVGYPNQLHFSRAFKNRYGVSPRTWRQEHGRALPHS